MREYETMRGLELIMKRISIIISLIAVILMVLGFGAAFALNGVSDIPGASALPPNDIMHFGEYGWGVWAMSTGILLLALLPLLRLVLAVAVFFRSRDLLDMGIGLIVLLELFASMRIKG